ncbi:hypothetical protein PGT21_017309 [Puccinia graminis f. sp. tritici]|uniref:Uncharacterized protein n=2 Tax=Puccinia graminis f. sp. tritici TaxID=56615 RepID=A0A5B0MK20_PUCGR|nr:hypothetical protein PGTUg99_002279 [Puccinia graminis f. sp. tritici]KAA1090900.1 hypothetical protein PGT21_017309 [Puccinia graminis f. sp. tritici]
MEPQYDPLSSWKTPSWPNPSSIQTPPTRRFSTRSDRERDAPEYARALSSDVDPYASSIISSSDSNSHYRSSRGSRGSIASSLLCPLLEFHDSSRRQSDAGLIMPMRPLPAINPSSDPSALYSTSHLDSAYRAQSLLKQSSGTSSGILSSTAMSNSNSTSGGNLFIPLRRRFLPNLDRTSSTSKPRVETQLLGELLLALEEYVAAFGRQVKVSPSHQFSLGGGSAAVVVVAAAAGPSNDPTITDLATSNLVGTSPDEETQDAHSLGPLQSTNVDSTLINLDSPETELWGSNTPNPFDPSAEELDETLKNVHLVPQSQCKVDRALLTELCEELEYVTSEVIDVVPAFGEKLMQGHYGPLAARGHLSTHIPSPAPDMGDSENRSSGSSQTKSSSALERFSDHEPGGSQDTSDGGSGWWAERLLRDLLEGIVAETVVKSGSTTTLLSSNTNLSSNFDHSEMSRLSSQNNSRHYTSDKTSASDRKAANHITNSLGGKSKNWLRMPQSSSLPRSTSVNNPTKHTANNRNLGFSLIDEREESSTTPEAKRKSARASANKNQGLQATRLSKDLIVVPDGHYHSTLTRELLAEASQDSIFEYRHSPDKEPNILFESNGLSSPEHQEPYRNSKNLYYPQRREAQPVDLLGQSDGEAEADGSAKAGIDDDHRQRLLDEGRKRWLAFKANQSSSPCPSSTHPAPRNSSGTHSSHFLSNLPSLRVESNHQSLMNNQLGRGRSSSSSSIIRPHHHQSNQLHEYIASHRS